MPPKSKSKSKSKAKSKPKAKSKAEPESSSMTLAPRQRGRKRTLSDREADSEEPLHLDLDLSHSGSVFVWGMGDMSQLGLGEDIVEKMRPYPLSISSHKIARLCCGGMHTVVITDSGSVFSWGVGEEGALGRPYKEEDGDPDNGWTPRQVAVLEKQEEKGEEEEEEKQQKQQIRPVSVSCGDSHTMLLMSDGSVRGCGNFRSPEGAWMFVPGVKKQYSMTQVASKASRFKKIVSGNDHVMAINTQGQVFSWGWGGQGQLGRVGGRLHHPEREYLTPGLIDLQYRRGRGRTFPRDLGKAVAIGAGMMHSFIVTENDSVVGFGMNNMGQLGVEPEPASEPVVLVPMLIPGLSGKGVVQITGADHHSLALATKDNVTTVYACGKSTYGRLGIESLDMSKDEIIPPTAASKLDGLKVAAICAKSAVSGCLTEDGEMFMWGMGDSNQLGKGDDPEDSHVPTLVPRTKRFDSSKKAVQLDCGAQHCAAIVREE